MVLALAVLARPDARAFGPVPFIGLPSSIDVCGRSYDRDGQDRVRTVDEMRTLVGAELVIVDPWLHAPCVAGACTRTATQGPCATVLYVRVGRDGLLGYELQGGP